LGATLITSYSCTAVEQRFQKMVTASQHPYLESCGAASPETRRKSLWMSHATPNDRRLVFAESVIGALG